MKNTGKLTSPYVGITANKNEPLDIYGLYKSASGNRDRFMRLISYYQGEAPIFERQIEQGKPNHKLAANYAKYITTLASGYFIGKPIGYNVKDEALSAALHGIFSAVCEDDHNCEIAKNMSICGVAYELLWLDEQANIRMSVLDPRSVTLVHANDFSNELICAIREYSTKEGQRERKFLEVYTKDSVDTYAILGNVIEKRESRPHYFGGVPVVEYRNNEERSGDFEVVTTLIDAYNLAISDSANDISYFTDAYLALIGYGGTTAEEVAQMREDRVLLLAEGGDAKFLTKNNNDADGEQYKTRLQEDIHRLSMVPSLTDESFAGNLSGVAIEYKLFGLEQLAITKERKFSRAIRTRLALIVDMLNTKGAKFDCKDIALSFNRNIPQNESEIVDTAIKLSELVSRKTVLATLPMVTDVASEMTAIECDCG